jgi:hypothetical protein
VGGEGRARRAVVLAPDLLPLEGEEALGLGREEADFSRREDLRQKDVAVTLEAVDLIIAQFHRRLPDRMD